MNATQSTGHRMNLGKWEYFTIANGDLYRAPLANPVVNGMRGGARWEAPAHMVETWLEMAQAQMSAIA